MPTTRAVIPATLKVEVEVSRDFYVNKELQVAEALYRRLMELDDEDAIDLLKAAIVETGEGAPVVQPPK